MTAAGPPATGATATAVRPAAAPEPVGPAGGAARRGWRAAGLFVAVEAVLLGLIAAWQPRFFYYDDLQVQYIPVWRWLGERVTSGGVPQIDPDQGSGGALVADLQYGVLDPLHWLLALAVSHVDDMNLVAWGLHLLVVVVLGLGTTVLATHLGARPVWAAAAALGAVNCGFLLWFASWWPAGWSAAWVPWLWWALSSRSRWALPVAVLASYALMTSGYPYVLPFTGVMVLGVLAEQLVRRREQDLRPLVARVVAAAGGALLGATGLITASALTPLSQRSQAPADPFGNPGTYIPNLLDVLLGGSTTSPSIVGWWGDRLPPSVTAIAWFVLPTLALVRWRARPDGLSWWRAPGVVPALALCLVAVVATQTPTIVADLRYPFRYVLVLEVTAPLLVAVLASRCGLVTTRRRLLVAAGLLCVQAGLAVSRTPALLRWHALLLLLGLLVLGAVAVLRRREGGDEADQGDEADEVRPAGPSGWARTAVALPVLALLVTAVAPLTSIGTAIDYQAVDARAIGEEPSGLPARGVYESDLWPSRASEFEAVSQGVDLDATVIWWPGPGSDRGALQGAPVGSAGLITGMRTGYGYTSLGHDGWANRWCADLVGQLNACPAPQDRLLEQVPGTDVTWLEALSKDVVLLDDRAPEEMRAGLERQYEQVREDRGFLRYERRDPTPGRVTWTSADVESVAAVDVAPETETYRVSWTGDDARLLARIPWWPGYEASLDGRPVDLEVVEDTAVAVALPDGGGSGELTISYHRPRAALGHVAVAVGAVLALAGLALGLLPRRRTRTG